MYTRFLSASTFFADRLHMARPQGERSLREPKANDKKKRSRPLSIPEKVIRLLEIYTLIAQGRHPSVRLLMNRLGISKRTVFRYLEIIDMINPITYDLEQKGYAHTDGNGMEKLRLSHDELLMVLAAGEAVSRLGKPFGERFRRLISSLDLVAKTQPD